jgi:hypothetical protein
LFETVREQGICQPEGEQLTAFVMSDESGSVVGHGPVIVEQNVILSDEMISTL